MLRDIEKGGIDAVRRHSRELDGWNPESFVVSDEGFKRASAELDDDLKEAIAFAQSQVRALRYVCSVVRIHSREPSSVNSSRFRAAELRVAIGRLATQTEATFACSNRVPLRHHIRPGGRLRPRTRIRGRTCPP